MFKKNISHEQGLLFTEENDMDPRLKKKLNNHWSGIFYEKIFCNIDEKLFKPLYNDQFGRTNFPVNILVSLEILKEMFSLTDEQLLDRYHFDLSLRRALGLTDINEHILASRTFYYFRSSVANYSIEHDFDFYTELFNTFRDDIITELGIKTGLQRTDSTMISANIKKMSMLTLFHKVLSNFVKDLLKLEYNVKTAIQEIVNVNEDRFSYKLKKDEILSKTKEISEYLYNLVELYSLNDTVKEMKSYQDAKRLLSERCDIIDSKISLKKSKDIGTSSMQNPADGDATYRKKRNIEHSGYAAHATETCDKDNVIQVITDVDLVPNNIDDSKVFSPKVEALKETTGLETIIGDSHFVSDDIRDECKKNNVKLIATEIRGRPPKHEKDKNLNSRSFDIDPDTDEVKSCPAGYRPTSQKKKENEVIARFSGKVCSECAKNEYCIAYNKSKKESCIVINEKRKWLDERNELLDTKEFKELCKLRPAVEGLMEKLKPKYLNGRILFRGLTKVKARMVLRGIGRNFKRYSGYKIDLCSCIS